MTSAKDMGIGMVGWRLACFRTSYPKMSGTISTVRCGGSLTGKE